MALRGSVVSAASNLVKLKYEDPSDATLRAAIVNGALVPGFRADTLTYAVNVRAAFSAVSVAGFLSNPSASMSVTPTPADTRQGLVDVRQRLSRIWHVIEMTDIDMSDASDLSRSTASVRHNSNSPPRKRGQCWPSAVYSSTVPTRSPDFASEMSDFLRTSELTETRTFVRSFVKQITVKPGQAVIHYTIPMPEDSPIGSADAAEVALSGGVMSAVRVGRPGRDRTSDRWIKSPLLCR